MKLHLPLTLLTAVLAAFIALPAQAVEVPDGYTEETLNRVGTLNSYSTLSTEDYIAFILSRSLEFSPTSNDYWTSSTPLVQGGNVFFGSRTSPVALSFKDGSNSVFSNQGSLSFDTLSNLTFSTINGKSISGGSLIINNVDDNQSETMDVVFEKVMHTASSPTYGGAISAYDATISNNGVVSFSASAAASYGSDSYRFGTKGGAIYASRGLTISYNNAVSFSGNVSNTSCYMPKYDEEGAPYDNFSYGGAIFTDSLNICYNNNISFCQNTSNSSYTTQSQYGRHIFPYSYGGAIYASGDLNISNNGAVSFRDNSSVAYSTGYHSYSCGGAIYASNSLSINNNSDVSFIGNSTSSAAYGDAYSYGGAIYATQLSIQGNNSVLFEKNYEKNNSKYRLSSINAGSLYLSAKNNGDITFYDSVSVRGKTYFNSNYTDADGNTQRAEGNIIFSGKYAEQHLNEILTANNENRTASTDEIQNSQTSSFGTIYLENGSLQVVDGARLNGCGLQVNGDAKLLLRDSVMNHSGYSLTFDSVSELELQGVNSITANSLTLNSGTTLTATLTDANQQQASIILSGNLNIGSSLTFNLNVESEDAKGMYRIISLTDSSKYDVSNWTANNITFNGSGAAENADFGDLMWQDGVLYYAASPMWHNTTGNGVWSRADANWNNGSVFRNGQDVLFTDIGAGAVLLSGDLAPSSISINSNSDYNFSAADEGGRLVGDTNITKTGSGNLTIATANTHSGDTELLAGSLNIQHSTALGATAEGEAALIAAEGTAVIVENDSQVTLAAEGNSIAGSVEVSEGASLEMKNGSYTASNSTVNGRLILSEQTEAKLSGTTTVNGSLSIIGSASSAITGIVDIAEGAALEMIGGSYATTDSSVNGTLSLNEVNATVDTLSGNGSVLVKNSRVSFSNSSAYTGNLSVKGNDAELILNKGGYKGNGTVEVQGGNLTLENRGNITLEEGGQLAVCDEATVSANSIKIQEGATLSIGDVSAVVELNSLMSGSEMAVYTTAAAEGYDPTVAVHTAVGAILDTNSLNLFGGSSLLANGAHIDMNGTELSIYDVDDQKVNLTLTLGANYTPDSQVVLFSNVGYLYLELDDIFGVTGDGIVYTVNADNYFTGEWINERTTLNYDSTANVVYLQGVSNVVPEPTTATLSLLALAALAMRRRRK